MRSACKGLLPQLVEEPGGEIALAEVGKDDDDQLARVLRVARKLDRRVDRRAGGDAHQQALLTGQAARHGEGLVVGHLDDLVDQLRLQHGGHKARADALNLVRAGSAAGEHVAVRGLDGHGPEARLARLDVLADAGQRAAGADAGDENVRLAIGVVPYLRAGGLKVDLRVCGVVELLQDEAVGRLALQLLGLGDGALHAVRARRQNNLRAVGEQQNAALHAHRLRHGEDDAVSLDRGHKRQADAGVAAGGLDQHGFAGLDLAIALGGLDHGQADAVLHAAGRVAALQLGDYGGGGSLGDPVQLNQRCAADQIRDFLCDVHCVPFDS